jgi:hypothetical protein
MVAMSKELKEKREIEAQKLQIKQKRQLAIQKAEQVYQVKERERKENKRRFFDLFI